MAHSHYLAKKLVIYYCFENMQRFTTFLKLEFVKLEFQKLEFVKLEFFEKYVLKNF